jgi:uncharacterized protein YjiS (DUF1127 family)
MEESMTSLIIEARAPCSRSYRGEPRVAKTIDRLIAWIRNQLRIRRDTHQLLADDRLLADIGLTREQVERAMLRGGSSPTGHRVRGWVGRARLTIAVRSVY